MAIGNILKVLDQAVFSLPKFIEPVPGGPQGQLYNLKTDPREQENLYLSEPKKVEEFKLKLKEIRGY